MGGVNGHGPIRIAVAVISDGISRNNRPLCEQGIICGSYFKRRPRREVGPVSGRDCVPSGKSITGPYQRPGIAKHRSSRSCQVIVIVLGGGPGGGAVAVVGNGIGRVGCPLREQVHVGGTHRKGHACRIIRAVAV